MARLWDEAPMMHESGPDQTSNRETITTAGVALQEHHRAVSLSTLPCEDRRKVTPNPPPNHLLSQICQKVVSNCLT